LNAAQNAILVEQRRQNDRMPGHPRAKAALGIKGIVDGAADIVLLVIEPSRYLIEAVRLGPAFAEVLPLVERLPRRTAITAAGEVTPVIGGHFRGLEAKLEPVDLPRIALSTGRRRRCSLCKRRARSDDLRGGRDRQAAGDLSNKK
jgi:hypothetical protein